MDMTGGMSGDAMGGMPGGVPGDAGGGMETIQVTPDEKMLIEQYRKMKGGGMGAEMGGAMPGSVSPEMGIDKMMSAGYGG